MTKGLFRAIISPELPTERFAEKERELKKSEKILVIAVLALVVLARIYQLATFDSASTPPATPGGIVYVYEDWLNKDESVTLRIPARDDGTAYAKVRFDRTRYWAEIEEPNGVDFEEVQKGRGAITTAMEEQTRTIIIHDRRTGKVVSRNDITITPVRFRY